MTATAPATERQLSFLRSLAADVYGADAPAALARIESDGVLLDRRRTSGAIDFLIAAKRRTPAPAPAAPAAPAAPVPGADVPAARYAVPAADGSWEFFQVDRPASGKWAGWTFVKRLTGAPGDFSKSRLSRRDSDAVLARIAGAEYRDGDRVLTGPEAAAVAFSREHGVCAACLAPLTDAESIARGLGPVCAGRF